MNAFDVLQERGFVQQCTDAEAVRAMFAAGPVTAYVGYDPTADSLHVGHLFSLMSLMHLARTGNKPIVLMGGGTAMVGDPSGKTEMRQMLTREAILGNIERIKKQVARLFGAGDAIVANNDSWLLELRYVDFLRDIGRHFSVNRMLSAEAYKIRLERGLSFIEFNYQLLQAYDFLELCKRHDCTLQMGGDDQWSNILAGVDLCRRLLQKQVQGLTSPLLMTAAGEKMGKTAAGAVWLDPEKVSPYDYYQYWVNTDDRDVARMLGFFTFLPMDEVRAVDELDGRDLNAAKAILAFEATCIVHGDAAATTAHTSAQAAFGGRELPASILPSSKVPRVASATAESMPTTHVTAAELATGLSLIDLLRRTEIADSNGSARRLIQQGGVRLGETKIDDDKKVVTAADFEGGVMLLKAGKKKIFRVVMQG
ncbi:MAG: tyrosine--tRNA ligase [Myxococcota bacterium]